MYNHSCAILILFKIMIIFKWNQNKVSWCIIENFYSFEQNEDGITEFLKQTVFSYDLNLLSWNITSMNFHKDFNPILLYDPYACCILLYIVKLWLLCQASPPKQQQS